MIKFENIEVSGFPNAIRGMRNPMQSWHKSDSYYDEHGFYVMGKNDINLAHRLYTGGSEHRKFMRQIFVSFDITSHHTFWSEFDTYKVGVTRDSCSKMHTIHVKSFERDDFSHEGIDEVGGQAVRTFNKTLETLEWLRGRFNESHEKKYWRAMIELLPCGYNLKATVSMNYEVAVNMIRQRSTHKIDEWREMCKMLITLPYLKEIMGEEE